MRPTLYSSRYQRMQRDAMQRMQRDAMQRMGGFEDELVAAETAASEMNPTNRAIVIGVLTGAITLVVNRLIDRLFFDSKK